MSWQTALRNLSTRHFMFFDRNGSMLESGIANFKEQYPGNYEIVEYFNTTAMKFDLTVQFESKQEELLWKIKWS